MDMPAIPMDEIGTTGLKHWNGYINEEFLPELKGTMGLRRLREMAENSAIVGACLRAYALLFRQFYYEWEPADCSNPQAEEIAERFTGALEDLAVPFADTIESNQSMFWAGWDLKERWFKYCQGLKYDKDGDIDASKSSRFDDGLVFWAAFAERAQESSSPYKAWDISENGSKILSWTQIDRLGVPRTIKAKHFLHFRTSRAKNNPEGRSLLRNAWFSWHFFKRISEAEAIGISRDLSGLAILDAPPEWFNPDAPEWQRSLLEGMRKVITTVGRGENEGLVMPAAYDQANHRISDIRLLNSGGKRQFDTGAIIERYERRMAMVLLADLIMMGHESTGSYALSDNKKNLLEIAIEGHSANILGTYQQDALRVMRMNGWPLELTPRLCAKTRKALDLGPLGDYISKIVAAGFKWTDDKALDDFLREQGGLPKRSKADPEDAGDAAPADPENPAEDADPGDAQEDA